MIKNNVLVFIISALLLVPRVYAAEDINIQDQSVKISEDAHLKEIISAGEWRVFSWVYSMMPKDGYSINFIETGKVHSESLAGAESWSIDYDNTLNLYDKDENIAWTFQYKAEKGIFINQGGVLPPLVIAPKGFDFNLYSEEKS